MKVRIGTRQSALALIQTELVAKALAARFPTLEIEVVKKTTSGDRNLKTALADFGGKGAFVSEFEEALLEGSIDLAVHSAKDLPAGLAEGLTVAAVLPRGDARDVLVWRNRSLQQAYQAGRLSQILTGTSSPRRALQVQALLPGCRTKLLRGNVPTRLTKLAAGEYDAIILAAAGLERLGLWSEKSGQQAGGQEPVFQPLSFEEMLPAGGQGIIALECRSGDKAVAELLSAVNDSRAMASFILERAVLAKLEAGCHEPTAVFSSFSPDGSLLTLTVAEEKEGVYKRKSLSRELSRACSSPVSGGYSREALLSFADAILEKAYD